MVAHVLLHFPHIRVVLELEVLLLECNGVVEEKLGRFLERPWEGVLGKVPSEGTRDIGENEGNIVSEGFGEDGGQSRECIVSADSDTLHGAIGEDENGSDRVDVLLDLSRNTILVALVLLNTSSIGQSWRIEDANLDKRSHILTEFVQAMPEPTIMPLLLVNS